MTQSSRIDFIDRLRGAALVSMFLVHSKEAWLAPWAREGQWAYRLGQLSGMVAPVFMFLVGVSIALFADASQKRGEDTKTVRRLLAVRGLKIVLLGYVLHALFFVFSGFHGPWIKMLKVDILHCIGLCLAIFPFIAWPTGKLNIKALACFVGLPILGLVTYNLPFEALPKGLAAYFSTRSTLALFPFVPYAAWTALGLVVGPLFIRASRDAKSAKKLYWYLALAGVGAYIFGLGLKHIYYGFGINELGRLETATKGLVHVFYTKTGFIFLLFAAFGAVGPFLEKAKLKPFVLFGKTSLFCYAVHLFFIYHIGGSFLARKLSPIGHMLGAIALTVLMYGLAITWSRISKRRKEGSAFF